MAYYIGVDGGGSKTAYALFDETRAILAQYEGPGSNHETLAGSYDEAVGLIWTGVASLLSAASITAEAVNFTLMGLAGVDHPYQREALMERLQARGLRRLEVVNDGFLVIKAGCGAGAGIGLNLGTGTCCNAVDLRGRQQQLAGVGDFSGDIGNGQWLITTTFRLVYDDCILGLAPTKLTAMVFEEFGLSGPAELLSLIEQLDSPGVNPAKMAFIRLFFAAADAGDPPALEALKAMALRGAQLIAAHLRLGDFPSPCEVVLSGSIHTKADSSLYLASLVCQTAKLTGHQLVFRKLTVPPVMGCINWMLEEYA